jgi:hypothetical protein
MLPALSCVTGGEVRPYDIDIAAFGPGFYVHKFVGLFFLSVFSHPVPNHRYSTNQGLMSGQRL